MLTRFLCGLLLGCTLLSCGGGGSNGSAPAPAPVVPVPSPALLPPSLTANSSSLTIKWLAPNGTIDGYELESRIGTGAYQKVHPGLLPASSTQFDAIVQADAPELSDFSFHIRAVRGNEKSPYSNEVVYHKPLSTPSQLVGQFDWNVPGVVLSWTGNSTLADACIIKRAESTNGGIAIGPWVTLESPLGRATTFTDKTAKLGLFYVYMVANLKGNESSSDSPASSVISTVVPAPSQLVATYDSTKSGVALVWGSGFAQADGVLLERAEADSSGAFQSVWTALPVPAGPQASYLDLGAQEGRSYIYRVSNIRQSVGSASVVSTESVTIPPLAPSGLGAVYDINQGAIVLTWTTNSSRSTGAVLERTEADAAGAPLNPWVSLPALPGSIATYTDRGTQEFTRYLYRVSNLRGTVRSNPSNTSSPLSTPLAVPTLLTAVFDETRGGVSLTWKTNSTHADNVMLERARADANGLPSSTWSTLYTYGALTSYLDTNASELTSYLYRVSNLYVSAPSAPSAPSAVVTTPLAPPTYVYSYYDTYAKGIYVYWNYNYGANRTFKVERAETDALGTVQGNWTSVPVVPNTQASLTDKNLSESKYYRYRVAITLDQYTTPFRVAQTSTQVPLLPATLLQPTPKPAGVDLSWQNQSLAATQIAVRRFSNGTSTDIASLPATATTYSDTNLPLGTYTYQIITRNASSQSTSSSVTATTLNKADSLTLTSANLGVPNASDAAVTPSGGWAFASQNPFGIASHGDPWAAIYPNTASKFGATMIQVDTSGHPHAVYLVPDLQDPALSVLKHLWFDGTSWNTEDLMTGKFSAYYYSLPAFKFTLDSTGKPQVLVNLSTASASGGGTIGSLSYVHFTGGAWAVDSLSTSSKASQAIDAFMLTLDATDNPHILVRRLTDGVEIMPSGPGTWTETTLTTENLNTYQSAFLDAVWEDADNGWIFYLAGSSNGVSSLKGRQKAAGVWQSPVVIFNQILDSYNIVGAIASNTSRSGFVVLLYSPQGLKAFHQDVAGWHETLVVPSTTYGIWFRAGFDASDKLRVIVNTQNSTTPFVEYHQ